MVLQVCAVFVLGLLCGSELRRSDSDHRTKVLGLWSHRNCTDKTVRVK
jgi:hypothetical protein